MRHARLVVPLADRPFEADQQAQVVGGVFLGTVAEIVGAPFVRNRLGAIEGRDIRRQILVIRATHRIQARVGHRGLDLHRREFRRGLGARAEQFDKHGVILRQLEGAAAEQIGALDREGNHIIAAVVIGAGIGGAQWRGHLRPQCRLVLRHAGHRIALARETERIGLQVLIGAAGNRKCGAERRAGARHLVGERRAGGIGRQAAARLETVGKAALVRAELVVIVDRQAHHDVITIFFQVAVAGQQGGAAVHAAARFGGIGGGRRFHAVVIGFQNEVDHAADGVGTVDGRRAVFQNFHARNGAHRNRVQVDRLAAGAVGGDAAPVQQHQGAVRSQAAQRSERRAATDPVGIGAKYVIAGGHIVGTGAVRRDGRQQLLGAGNALLFDLVVGDHLHRQRAFLGDALDTAARHFDPLYRLRRRFLRHGRASHPYQCHQLR